MIHLILNTNSFSVKSWFFQFFGIPFLGVLLLFFWQCPSSGNICWKFFCMQCFHNWGWETFDKCTLCWTCYPGNPLNSPTTDMVILFLWKRQNELKEMPERARSIYTCSVPESPRKNGREKKKIRTGANIEICSYSYEIKKGGFTILIRFSCRTNKILILNDLLLTWVAQQLFWNSFVAPFFNAPNWAVHCCPSHSAFSLLSKPDIQS